MTKRRKCSMQVTSSASRDVTQMDTVCVQTAEVVPVIRSCILCYGRPPYLPPRKLKLPFIKYNSEHRTYFRSVYFGSLLFQTHNTQHSWEKTYIYIYIYIYIHIHKRSRKAPKEKFTDRPRHRGKYITAVDLQHMSFKRWNIFKHFIGTEHSDLLFAYGTQIFGTTECKEFLGNMFLVTLLYLSRAGWFWVNMAHTVRMHKNKLLPTSKR